MSAGAGVRNVDQEECRPLLTDGAVRVLDVRTPEEYARLGHIPGALLLPVHLIPSAPAILTREGPPILVYCEHGIRSASAAEFLVRAGFPSVLNLAGGLSMWRGSREFGPDRPAVVGPSSWLVENADLLPASGRALDLACGAGRHALLLAAAGLSVHAVDREPALIEGLRLTAARLEMDVEAEVFDLEAGTADLGREAYDLILGIHYLHRPLFPALARALRPPGLLLYETFTVDQAVRGKPTRPEFLLEQGELPRLVAPLEVVRQREGEFEGRMVAGVAAYRRR